MINRLLILMVLISSGANAQKFKVDTVYKDKKNDTSWITYSKGINTYDENCFLILQQDFSWDTSTNTWKNASIYSKKYLNGNMIETTTKYWNVIDSTWQETNRYIYTYNNDNNLVDNFFERFSGGVWDTISKTTRTYDIEGRLFTELNQSANIGTLTDMSLVTYFYNNDGTLKYLETQSWDVNYSKWILNVKISYTYGEQKLPVISISQTWNTIIKEWEDISQKIDEYSATRKLLSSTIQYKRGSGWTNAASTIFTYDASDFLINRRLYNWNDTYSFWDKTWEYNYINYSDGSIKEEVTDVRNPYTLEWGTTRDRFISSFGCLLPLHSILLTGFRKETSVLLNWHTTEEINTSHFNIQRSSDGSNFINVGKIQAKGNGSSTYNFSDDIAGIKSATLYYRLESVDKDNKILYTNIVPVKLNNNKGDLTVYPNPVKNNLSMYYNLNQNSAKASLVILDISGRTVYTASINGNSAFTDINVAHLSKGIYYIQIFNGKETMRTKFIKE